MSSITCLVDGNAVAYTINNIYGNKYFYPILGYKANNRDYRIDTRVAEYKRLA